MAWLHWEEVKLPRILKFLNRSKKPATAALRASSCLWVSERKEKHEEKRKQEVQKEIQQQLSNEKPFTQAVWLGPVALPQRATQPQALKSLVVCWELLCSTVTAFLFFFCPDSAQTEGEPQIKTQALNTPWKPKREHLPELFPELQGSLQKAGASLCSLKPQIFPKDQLPCLK